MLTSVSPSWSNYDTVLAKRIYLNNIKFIKLVKKGFRNFLKDPLILFDKKRQTIKASAPGKVIYSSWGPGSYGKMIIVRHVGGRFHSVYANNSKNLVKLHQNVLAGTPIARAGNSRYKGKSTLRFEIRYRTVPKNPLSYLPKAY